LGDYFTWLTIPAGTPKNAPVEKEVTVEGQILDEIAYLIPPGWCALAHFSVFYGIKQIYPYKPEIWVTGDNLYRVVPLKWPLPELKTKLTLKGYNEDNTFPHTVYMWLLTMPEEEARPWRILADFVKILKRLMGIR